MWRRQEGEDATRAALKAENRKKETAPVRVVWSQFLRHCNEGPLSIWQWPHDYLLTEWIIFQQYAQAGESY